MFYIANANIWMWGRSVTWYAVTPILSAIAITIVNCLVTKKKGGDTSFVFRATVIIFCGVVATALCLRSTPRWLLPVMYVISSFGMVLIFWLCGKIFRKDDKAMLGLGLCSLPLFTSFSKLGCFLTGCCYGRAYDGPLRVVYGTNTENHFPGTSRFPIQLVSTLLFLLLAIIAYTFFIKGLNRTLIFALLFTDWFIYYLGTCLYDQRANQMIINGYNLALPLAIVTAVGGVICWILYKRRKWFNEKEKMAD